MCVVLRDENNVTGVILWSSGVFIILFYKYIIRLFYTIPMLLKWTARMLIAMLITVLGEFFFFLHI